MCMCAENSEEVREKDRNVLYVYYCTCGLYNNLLPCSVKSDL